MRLLLAVLFCASTAGAQMTRIGAAGAVAGAVKAVGQGQTVGRAVQSGKPLFLNDRVTTGPGGRLQVMLLDETIFTVGPNSDLTLDEFVYDPATNAGKVTAKVTKGVFRMVTGKIARREPGSVKVKMPVGTMGIRGTIVGGQVGENASTVILFGPGANNNAGETPGAVGVENAGSEVTLDQPGFGTTVSEGQAPAPPSDMSGQMGALFGDLEGDEGGSSGSSASSDESADGGGASASDESGEETAAAGASAGEFSADAESGSEFEDASNTAALEIGSGFAEGTPTWDQVRQLESGSGVYYGSGAAACAGGGCLTSSIYTDYQIRIDFGTREIGDATSSSSINLYDVVTAADNRGAYINPISFDSLAGDATLTLSAGNFTPFQAGDNYSGTTISLFNSNGELANRMAVDINAVSTISAFTVTGEVGGTFVPDQQGGGGGPE